MYSENDRSVCIVHGCCNPTFKPNKKWGQQQRVCKRHYYAMKSGRVGGNWQRDIHNFHRKGECADCGVTAFELGFRIFSGHIEGVRVRDVIKKGMQVLQGDHINGRTGDNAHTAENIQTLCSTCHHIKTIREGDHVPVVHRK